MKNISIKINLNNKFFRHISYNRLIFNSLKTIKIEKKENHFVKISEGLNENDCIIINEFLSVMENKVNKDNLTILYLNIEKVKILEFDEFPTGAVADYCGPENLIRKVQGAKKDAVFHELLHLSTCQYIINLIENYAFLIYGFYQNIFINGKTIKIGKGFNEGATEYYNKKYFKVKHYNTYLLESNIFSILNKVLNDEEKVEHLYFNADLKGLISLIAKYCPVNEVINFIREVDKLSEYNSKIKRATNYNINKRFKLYKDICLFLVYLYYQKRKSENIDIHIIKEEIKKIIKEINLFITKTTKDDRFIIKTSDVYLDNVKKNTGR